MKLIRQIGKCIVVIYLLIVSTSFDLMSSSEGNFYKNSHATKEVTKNELVTEYP